MGGRSPTRHPCTPRLSLDVGTGLARVAPDRLALCAPRSGGPALAVHTQFGGSMPPEPRPRPPPDPRPLKCCSCSHQGASSHLGAGIKPGRSGATGTRVPASGPAMAHGRTLPATASLQGWGDPPDSLGYSSSSPAASPDSCGLASPAAARGPCRGHGAPRPRGRKAVRGGGGAGVPRQSASEREKLRMRRLAQALLRLRHYLPPALAPAGHTLTKIETLRLATRYIAHLSALLGLGRRAPAPRHCPLCPRGLGCCQDTDPRDASPPGAAGWGSPPMAGTPPELHGAPGMGTGAWGSPLCSPAAGTAPELLGGPEMGLETWGSPPYTPATATLPDVLGGPNIGMETWGSPSYIPATGTPPELLGVSNIQTETWGSLPYMPSMGTPPDLNKAVTSTASPWLTPPHSAGAAAPPDLPGDALDTGLVLSEFVGTGTVTQDLSADLLSLLEALCPPQPR
ncbi:mesoderm posterior protein 2 [Acridotheres tristis]